MTSLENRSSSAKTFKGKLFWLHFPKCGTSFGSTLHGYSCTDTPTPTAIPRDGGPDLEVCQRCGANAGAWRGYDHTIVSSIPFGQRPYCDWNVSFHGAFKNHYVLPPRNDFSSADHVQAVGLFRDPRRRLVSGWCVAALLCPVFTPAPCMAMAKSIYIVPIPSLSNGIPTDILIRETIGVFWGVG